MLAVTALVLPSGAHAWKFRLSRLLVNSNNNDAYDGAAPIHHKEASRQTTTTAHSAPQKSRPSETATPVWSSDVSSFSAIQPPGKPTEQTAVVAAVQTIARTLGGWFTTVLLYKPPVGAVAFLLGVRLVRSGRIFQWEDLFFLEQTAAARLLQQQQQHHTRQEQRLGRQRSFVLDADDAVYRRLGGVQMVRARICQAALANVTNNTTTTNTTTFQQDDDDDDDPLSQAVQEALDHVISSSSSQMSLVHFLQQLLPLQSRVQTALCSSKSHTALVTDDATTTTATTFSLPADHHLVTTTTTAVLTLQVQCLDALLRLCRNRLVQTAHRLVRTVEHWESKITRSRRRWPAGGLWWWKNKKNDDADHWSRRRYAHAQAAYQAEVERLGRVVRLLEQRPADIDNVWLLHATTTTEKKEHDNDHDEQQQQPTTKQQPMSQSKKKPTRLANFSAWMRLPPHRSVTWPRWHHPQSLRIPLEKLQQFPHRLKSWFRRQQGRRHLPQEDPLFLLSPNAAREALTQTHSEQWMHDARQWSQQARQVLQETVTQSLEGSVDTAEYTVRDWESVFVQTCPGLPYSAPDDGSWQVFLQYVNALSTWRRVGEGKLVRLSDAKIVDWSRRLDVMGIPSYAASVWTASLLHRWIHPRWPQLRQQGLEVARTALDIWKARVWEPLVGLIDEIMNKSKGIMSALALEQEQSSLDHMLRDMGFGDGTASTRQEALQQATQQYEHDLRTGVFANFARGRLVRLLLVQVQQLKVGLLSALDTIDVLMKGNRIHLQILAFIPAMGVTYYGTRFFFRSLYNIRSKDLRPVKVVHGEMTLFLDQLERILLLGGPEAMEGSIPTIEKKQSIRKRSPKQKLSSTKLGELVLYVHRYLVMLDFSCPPFPASSCDKLHESLQDLVSSKASAEVDVAWLHTIQHKHQDLLKHI